MGYSIKKGRPYKKGVFEKISEGVSRNEARGYLEEEQSGQRKRQGKD